MDPTSSPDLDSCLQQHQLRHLLTSPVNNPPVHLIGSLFRSKMCVLYEGSPPQGTVESVLTPVHAERRVRLTLTLSSATADQSAFCASLFSLGSVLWHYHSFQTENNTCSTKKSHVFKPLFLFIPHRETGHGWLLFKSQISVAVVDSWSSELVEGVFKLNVLCN